MTFPDEDHFDSLARDLIGCELPKSEWTHEAHFAAALWFIRHPVRNAEREMPSVIIAYNEATGVANTDTDGYHETITLASIRMAKHYLAAHPGDTALSDVLSGLMRSPLGRSSWPLDYWTKPVLFSVTARRRWVDPDIKPLPTQV
ncbi:MAG: hypothetical protein QNI84_03460 [Henriciella sp.]|nr:hypothetical protein [Henriciella sp.]